MSTCLAVTPSQKTHFMATIMFSTLPAEIHVGIANHCKNNALISLCLTSKRLHERCLHVLYRHVNLRFIQKHLVSAGVSGAQQRKRRERFYQTLLTHPGYGQWVRSLKGRLHKSHHDVEDSHAAGLGRDSISEEDWWRAMRSLTHVQSVDVISGPKRMTMQFPSCGLFHSATSVRLAGHLPSGLAKSILRAINPATLKHLCLDMVVQDLGDAWPHIEYLPGKRGVNGRITAFGATPGLLTPLTGRCTALRTLVLRRTGQSCPGYDWNVAAEEASYTEWASFIRSVQGTLERFMFEQAGRAWLLGTGWNEIEEVRIMDDRFGRLVLPAIVTEKWPRLSVMDIRGVRSAHGQDALFNALRAVVGGNATVLVQEACGCPKPYVWNY